MQASSPVARRARLLAALIAALVAVPAQALAQSSVGLVDPTTGYWRLRQDDTVSGFYYGNPGDAPFMGDWDCDGIDTPGLYRRSDGFAYLRNSNTQGIADIRFYFGNPGDLPVPGDFDGDGCDSLSLFRPSQRRFYIINSLGSNETGLGAADFWFEFGRTEDVPVAGDFDGDGIDEVGVRRPDSGLVLYEEDLVENGGGGTADHEYRFGTTGDRFIVGDWDGDGVDAPAVYRPGRGTFLFGGRDGAGATSTLTWWGEPGWIPVSGVTQHPPASDPLPDQASDPLPDQASDPLPDQASDAHAEADPVEEEEAPTEAPPGRFPLLRPSDVPVTQYYGWRFHPIYLTWMFHFGWDFDVACGRSVVAPAAGTVTWAGWMDDRTGIAVRLDHGDGLVTSYAHLSDVLVELGDTVERADVFARAGSTGASTGCHLHFGIRQDGDWFDPQIALCPAVGAPSVPSDEDGCPDGTG